jgi:hypothetical protein
MQVVVKKKVYKKKPGPKKGTKVVRRRKTVAPVGVQGEGFFGDLAKRAYNGIKGHLQKNKTISTAILRAAPAIHDRYYPILGSLVGHLGAYVKNNTAYGRTAPGLKKLNMGLLR